MAAARISINADLKAALLDATRIPNQVVVNGKEYAVQRPVAAGFKGAIWKVADQFGRARAIKLAILEDYSDRSYLQEIGRAAELEPYKENFATFDDAGYASV